MNTEWFEMASNASGEGSQSSWWKGGCWSWDSWDGSSSGSRENWAYVTRREPGGYWEHSDPWHQWHGSWREHAPGQGEVRRSAQGQGKGSEQPDHSGESEGEDRPKGDLPSGKITSVQERADKEEEKKLSGKVSNSYPQFFELDKVKIIETGRDLSSFGYMVKDNNFPQAWLALGSWCSYVTEQHNSSNIWSRKM